MQTIPCHIPKIKHQAIDTQDQEAPRKDGQIQPGEPLAGLQNWPDHQDRRDKGGNKEAFDSGQVFQPKTRARERARIKLKARGRGQKPGKKKRLPGQYWPGYQNRRSQDYHYDSFPTKPIAVPETDWSIQRIRRVWIQSVQIVNDQISPKPKWSRRIPRCARALASGPAQRRNR